MSSSMENNNEPVSEYEKNLELLRTTRFFSAVPLDAVQALAYFCRRAAYQDGGLVFRQDETDHHFYYILEGEAELLRQGPEAEKVVGRYGPGETLGGLAMLAGKQRLFSLRAAKNLICLVISREKLLGVCTKSPEFAKKLMISLARNVIEWEERRLAENEAKGVNCLSGVGVSLI